MLPEGGTTSSAACVRRLPQRGRHEKGRRFALSIWGKTSVYRHGKTSVYRYARSLILWGFYAGRGGRPHPASLRSATFPKGQGQTVAKPLESSRGPKPSRISIVPSGMYGEYGRIFAVENPIFQCKNRFLRFSSQVFFVIESSGSCIKKFFVHLFPNRLSVHLASNSRGRCLARLHFGGKMV